MELTLDQIDAEIEDFEPLTVRLDAETVLTLPNPRSMPTDTLLSEDIDLDSPSSALKALLGEEEYDLLLHFPGMTLGRMEVIFNHWTKHYGILPLGEGAASPNSLNRAARRSKQTSASRRTVKAS